MAIRTTCPLGETMTKRNPYDPEPEPVRSHNPLVRAGM